MESEAIWKFIFSQWGVFPPFPPRPPTGMLPLGPNGTLGGPNTPDLMASWNLVDGPKAHQPNFQMKSLQQYFADAQNIQT